MQVYIIKNCCVFFLILLCSSFTGCKKNEPIISKDIKHHDIKQWLPKSSPALVWSASNQPDPKNIKPAIFYTPHQDDETIGMGASIAQHVRAGRPVYVVLLTNGANSEMLRFLQNKFNSSATMKDLTEIRNNELIAACQTLGVHRVYIANSGIGYNDEAVGPTGTESWIKTKNDFKSTMQFFATKFPNASHKTISGNCDSYNTNCDKMPTHQAAATAMHELFISGEIKDVRLFRVYCYYWKYGTCDRCSSYFSKLSDADKKSKQRAINSYKTLDIEHQRYGIAYNYSVGSLFNQCWNSDYEYVDYIANDY